MKKNLEAAARRQEKIQAKQSKQAKVLKILGIVTLVLVAVFAIVWAVRGIESGRTRDLSLKEVQALFVQGENLPKEEDPLLGTWYFYQEGELRTKYIITADGDMDVYSYEDGKASIQAAGNYRLRKHTNEMYVHPKGDSKFICYTYDIFSDENLYYMDLSCAGKTWRLVKLASEPEAE